VFITTREGRSTGKEAKRKSAEGSTLRSQTVVCRVQGNSAEKVARNSRAGENTTGVHITAF